MIGLENVLKISWRYFCKISCRLLKTSSKCLAKTSRRFLKTSWRRLQNVLKTSSGRLEDVLKTSSEDVWLGWIYSSWSRRLQDVFKTPSEDEDERRLHQDKCLLVKISKVKHISRWVGWGKFSYIRWNSTKNCTYIQIRWSIEEKEVGHWVK